MHLEISTIRLLCCGLCLLARLSDITTTWLGSPRLAGESNLLAKKLGWTFICLTAFVALVPLYDVVLGMAITIGSFLAAFSNAAKLLAYTQLGEENVQALIRSSIRIRGAFRTWLIAIGPSLMSLLIGVTLYISADRYLNEFVFGSILGFFIFAAAVAVHSAVAIRRMKFALIA